MTTATPPRTCRFHFWDRRLEVHNHVERVVRTCTCCGLTEVCWIRRSPPITIRQHVEREPQTKP
jgi:hypothetical protein